MKIFENITHFAFLLIILAGLLPIPGVAQKPQADKGKIEIFQDPKLDILVSKHIQINQKQEGIDGFRVQVFFDSGSNAKTQAQAVQEEFRSKHPDVEAYLTFKSPNYRVRVGNFRTRLDAQHFLNEISTDYPNGFITDEQIVYQRINY